MNTSIVIHFAAALFAIVNPPGMALVILCLLLASRPIGRLPGSMGLDIAPRLMGLILAAMGAQFALAGLADVGVNWIDPAKLG